MIATTGHTWDQVRNEWDLPRLEAWTTYCDSHPPLRAMVQAYLGIEPKVKMKAETVADLLEVLANFPGANRNS